MLSNTGLSYTDLLLASLVVDNIWFDLVVCSLPLIILASNWPMLQLYFSVV